MPITLCVGTSVTVISSCAVSNYLCWPTSQFIWGAAMASFLFYFELRWNAETNFKIQLTGIWTQRCSGLISHTTRGLGMILTLGLACYHWFIFTVEVSLCSTNSLIAIGFFYWSNTAECLCTYTASYTGIYNGFIYIHILDCWIILAFLSTRFGLNFIEIKQALLVQPVGRV